jgi:regulatory protein
MSSSEVNCRKKAMDYLARREHGFLELVTKLKEKGFSELLSHETVLKLKEEDLQSDERYAEMIVNVRSARGYGPLRIAYELKIKGIETEIIDDEINKKKSSWEQIGLMVLNKKLKNTKLEDKEQFLKAYKFLQQRGFDHQDAKEIIKLF